MNINYKIGDCREVMKNDYEEGVFDACVTDPPYGLEFMGKEWDKLDIRQPDDETFHRSGVGPFDRAKVRHSGSPVYGGDVDEGIRDWHYLWTKEVYRVLKPGGHLLAFGGTRTYDLMVNAVRKAGFEIRDTIGWLYGSGFPKSLAFAWETKAIDGVITKVLKPEFQGLGYDGFGTALKPAIELIVKARKPISEKNVAMNVLTHGVGGLNIDATRIEGNLGKPWGRVHPHRGNHPGWPLDNEMVEAPEPHPRGRFPANLILECTCEKVIPGKLVGNGHVPKLAKMENKGIYGKYNPIEREERHLKEVAQIHTNPNCPCYMLDAQSGELQGPWGKGLGKHSDGKYGYSGGLGGDVENWRWQSKGSGASRFFYVAKASRKERWFYCSVCKKAYSGDKREAHKKHSMHCLDCGVDYEPEYPLVQGRDGAMRDSDPFAMVGRLKEYNKPIDDHREHKTKTNLLFHVTQKPEQLIRYLIRLVTPKGGTVLDPFVGSGTTLVAARMEGMNALGIEIGTEYEPLIRGRLNALPRALEEFHQPTTTPSPKESIKYTQETE